MMTAGNLLVTGIEFLAIWALFARFGSLQDWTLPQVAVFLRNGTYSLALAGAGARALTLSTAMCAPEILTAFS